MPKFDTIVNHIPEITALLIAVAGGVRWFLQWRAKREATLAARRRADIKEAPSILDASLESLQNLIDFYSGVLRDCQHELSDCRQDVDSLRKRLKKLISPEVK
jgi:hypothetical protein